MPNPRYINPHKGVTDGDPNCRRIALRVSEETYQHLSMLRLGTGTIQTTLNLLLTKIINECHHRGYRDALDGGGDVLENLCADGRIVLPSEVPGLAALPDLVALPERRQAPGSPTQSPNPGATALTVTRPASLQVGPHTSHPQQCGLPEDGTNGGSGSRTRGSASRGGRKAEAVKKA